MDKIIKSIPTSGFEKITSPIPLIAIIGVVSEIILLIMTFKLPNSTLHPALIFASIGLPFFLIIMIYVLVTKHFQKLYKPSDYENSDAFLEVLRQSQSGIEKIASLNRQDSYDPFFISHVSSKKEIKMVKKCAGYWEKNVFPNIRIDEFLTLHSWYNEQGVHDLALLCIDIAIAKGMITSKNYSYRSASLRNLGRTNEAKHSAHFALVMDNGNMDAQYNLARLYNDNNELDLALEHAKNCYQQGKGPYDEKIIKYFPVIESEKENNEI